MSSRRQQHRRRRLLRRGCQWVCHATLKHRRRQRTPTWGTRRHQLGRHGGHQGLGVQRQPRRDRAELWLNNDGMPRPPQYGRRPGRTSLPFFIEHRDQEQQQPERADLRARRCHRDRRGDSGGAYDTVRDNLIHPTVRGAWSRTTSPTPRRGRRGRTARAASRAPRSCATSPRTATRWTPSSSPTTGSASIHQQRHGDRGAAAELRDPAELLLRKP